MFTLGNAACLTEGNVVFRGGGWVNGNVADCVVLKYLLQQGMF